MGSIAIAPVLFLILEMCHFFSFISVDKGFSIVLVFVKNLLFVSRIFSIISLFLFHLFFSSYKFLPSVFWVDSAPLNSFIKMGNLDDWFYTFPFSEPCGVTSVPGELGEGDL